MNFFRGPPARSGGLDLILALSHRRVSRVIARPSALRGRCRPDAGRARCNRHRDPHDVVHMNLGCLDGCSPAMFPRTRNSAGMPWFQLTPRRLRQAGDENADCGKFTDLGRAGRGRRASFDARGEAPRPRITQPRHVRSRENPPPRDSHLPPAHRQPRGSPSARPRSKASPNHRKGFGSPRRARRVPAPVPRG